MSAFVVSRTHIDALLSAADLWDVQMPVSQPGEQIRNLTIDETGALLMAVNTEAVNHRYNENEAPEPYTFDRLGINIKPAVILKAIACYRYQACEHPQWRADRDQRGISADAQTSYTVRTAQDFLDDLERKAVSKLAGYSEAPWGIDDDQREIFGSAVVRLF